MSKLNTQKRRNIKTHLIMQTYSAQTHTYTQHISGVRRQKRACVLGTTTATTTTTSTAAATTVAITTTATKMFSVLEVAVDRKSPLSS